MMPLKCCTQHASKFGKLHSGHRAGKGQFHSSPKQGQCQRMFKILCNCVYFTCQQNYAKNPSGQASAGGEPRSLRLKLDLEEAEEPENKLQITSIFGSQKKQRYSKINIHLCFIDCTNAFENVDHNKLWKILQELRMPDYLTCLLRSLYAGQKAMARTGHGTMDWFKIGKGVWQGCIL